MLNELKAIEAQLKQVLYECVEHVQATKAALYLSTSHDLNEKTYELVTSYQYNAADRKIVTANDDLVDRLAVKRTPFFVNGLGTDQRFSEMLFRQGNDRMLAAPLFSRGRLVGFIDMRDKAGRKPFDGPDVEAARHIAEQMTQLLAQKQLFGLAPVAVVEQSSLPQNAPSDNLVRPSAPLAAPTPAPVPTAPPAGARNDTGLTSQALRAIQAARDAMSRRQLNPSASPARHVLNAADLDVVRLLLPATLAVPGAAMACFSAVGLASNPQTVVAIATVHDDALEMLRNHLLAWHERVSPGGATNAQKPQLVYPFGVQVVPVTAAGISTILSAPVNGPTLEGLVLTVAFERTPEPQAQRALHVFLRQIEHHIDAAVTASSGRTDRQAVAEKLLEPDFQKFPELAEHSREVSAIAQRLARALELPAQQIETVRLAALVHDVGLRLLDYERIYKRSTLSPEEVRAIGEHPVIGAALVEPLLGHEIAQAVLRHHERPDGKGYPSRLTGQQIPLSARIIAIADAWVAMTSRQSYKIPVTPEQAVARLQEGAGTQFDAAVLDRFLRQLGAITG